MRAVKLTSLRKSPWLPVLAAAMTFTLVIGQVFRCCSLNESVSAGVGKLLKSLRHHGGHGPAHEVKVTHAGCHGHGESSKTQTLSASVDEGGPHLKSDETCLSEVAVTPKAIQSTSLEISGLFHATPILLLVADPISPDQFEKPKPQNKSSPPVYLLTLRILV